MAKLTITPTLRAALGELATETVNYDLDYRRFLDERYGSHLHQKVSDQMRTEADLARCFEGALQNEWDAWIGKQDDRSPSTGSSAGTDTRQSKQPERHDG